MFKRLLGHEYVELGKLSTTDSDKRPDIPKRLEDFLDGIRHYISSQRFNLITMEALAAGSAVKPLPVGRQDEHNRVCIDPAWLIWDDVDLRSLRNACCYVDSSEFVSPAPPAPIGEQDLDKTFVELTDQNITSVSPGQQPHIGWFIHGTVMSWHIQKPASSNVRGVLCPGVANPMEKGSSHGVLFARLKTS